MLQPYGHEEEMSVSTARAIAAADRERQGVLTHLYHDAVDGADYSLALMIELTREFGVERIATNLRLVAALHGRQL